MLSELKGQVESLASKVNTSSPQRPEAAFPAVAADTSSSAEAEAIFNGSSTESSADTADRSPDVFQTPYLGVPAQRFYGPTSPDYALNVAQLKMRRDSHAGPPLHQRQLQLAGIHEEDVSGSDDEDRLQDGQHSEALRDNDKTNIAPLLTFRSIICLPEAIRLLCTFQEVIVDLHPIVNTDSLMAQTRSLYSVSDIRNWESPTSGTEATTCEILLILNLSLAIALHSDSDPKNHNNECIIRDSFQNAVNAKMAAPASSIKHATIILLKGWYDLFQDIPRSAWRMCGIAGRILMELGFHNGEVSNHILSSEAMREEASTLICSIVILDRQWSSSTGLPHHFNDASFSLHLTSSVKNPHLKAMLSFVLISDRFSEPIWKVSKGEGYSDESAFELMSFQVEQWRKKSVGSYSLEQFREWHTDPSTRPPTWAILLNLRAESVRALLLMPFFFSEVDMETTKNHVRAATDLVYDIIDVLQTLDNTTDIYRKQHPYYQHVLASAAALAFLLIAFIKQNRAAVLPSLSPSLIESLGGSFGMAVALTMKYTKTSRSARRLAKRLVDMRLNLLVLGIIHGPGPVEQQQLMSSRFARKLSAIQPIAQSSRSPDDHLISLFAGRATPSELRASAFEIPTPNAQMQWADQWHIGDVNTMFSESMMW